MTEALERLLVIGAFAVLAAWFGNDVRHHLRDGKILVWRKYRLFPFSWVPSDNMLIRARDPFNYWSYVVGKGLAAIAAAILAIAYFWFSAIT